jgi:hypothetical protein
MNTELDLGSLLKLSLLIYLFIHFSLLQQMTNNATSEEVSLDQKGT